MNPGDIVWWKTNETGSRTGKFIRVVERGRKFDLVQIEPTDAVPRKTVYIRPEYVELAKPSKPTIQPKTQGLLFA